MERLNKVTLGQKAILGKASLNSTEKDKNRNFYRLRNRKPQVFIPLECEVD